MKLSSGSKTKQTPVNGVEKYSFFFNQKIDIGIIYTYIKNWIEETNNIKSKKQKVNYRKNERKIEKKF